MKKLYKSMTTREAFVEFVSTVLQKETIDYDEASFVNRHFHDYFERLGYDVKSIYRLFDVSDFKSEKLLVDLPSAYVEALLALGVRKGVELVYKNLMHKQILEALNECKTSRCKKA